MVRVWLVLFFAVKLFSCGPGYNIPTYLDDGYYNFLPKSKNPLFRYANVSSRAYDRRYEYYANIKKELNIEEWSKFLDIDKKDVEYGLYENKKIDSISDKKKQKEFSEYKQAIFNPDDDMTRLARFLQLYIDSTDDFFKLRIAYNIIKTYHNLKKYDKELEFIKKIRDELKVDSIVWEWIESYEAGALQHKGDMVASAYLFAKVFATHKSDNYIGYYDFKIQSDEQWKELLYMAKSSEEKTLFHFLRALDPKNDSLSELIEMTKIDKNSIWTKRLFNMVAQKAQFSVFDGDKKFVNYFIYYLKDIGDKDMLSYFEFIYHDKKPKVSDEKFQKVLDYLYWVGHLKKFDEREVSKRLKEVEKRALKEIVDDIRRWTFDKIKRFYPKGSLKRELSVYFVEHKRSYTIGEEFRESMSKEKLESYLALLGKKDKTYLESLMLSTVKLSKERVKVYKSIFYTDSGEFKKALEYVVKLKEPNRKQSDIYSYKEYLNSMRVSLDNPFNLNYTGNNRENYDIDKFYTHKKFLQTVIKIEDKLKKEPNSVMDNLLMANAWYNLSEFGNSPMFAFVFRSVTTLYPENSAKKLKKAEFYYQKALKHAKSDELKAKILYGLMKVAMHKKLLSSDESFYTWDGENFGILENILKGDKEYQKLYDRFKNYHDTKFFKKVKQCAIFKFFD